MAGLPGSGGFERTIDSAERDNEAAQLRAKRWSYTRIAEHLGFHDRSGARKAVQRAILATVQEAGDELRRLELEQLDRAAERAWQVAETLHYAHGNGRIVLDPRTDEPLLDDAPTLAALDRVLKIMERRAKLLGLDAPVRTEVITLDAVDAEITRLEAELAGRVTAGEAAIPPGTASSEG